MNTIVLSEQTSFFIDINEVFIILIAYERLGCHSDAAVDLKQPSQKYRPEDQPLNRPAPAEQRLNGFTGRETWVLARVPKATSPGFWVGDGLFLTGFPGANCFFRPTEDNDDADDITAPGWTLRSALL